MIGFSEIHDASKQLSTYDGTAILEREWSYMKDTHMVDKHGREMTNDFEEYDRVTDPRYKFEYSIFDIGNPVREYTGSELIRFVSNEELSKIRQDNGFLNVPLFVTKFDSENASGVLKIKMNLPEAYSLGDVFKNMNIRDLIVIGLILGFVVILIYAGYYELNLKMQIANTLQLQGIDWWFYVLY